MFFVFQAEDGIRDLVRSRGLGDVYKRQGEIRLPASNDHKRNFLECVRTRGKTVSPIEAAVRSDTICHLDDIAIRLGRRLHWDPQKELFVADDTANRMLRRPMRSPWTL